MAKSKNNDGLGEPLEYDPDFNGPLKRRSCTDVLCLGLFIVFIAIWIGIGLYAILNGDPSMLLVPKDSSGRRCGKDTSVKDKPYLLFFDLTKCLEPTVPFTGCHTPQVCVSSCPSEFYLEKNGTVMHQHFEEYCIQQGAEPVEPQCPEWLLPSQPLEKRCIPILAQINESMISQIQSDFSLDKLKSSIRNIKVIGQAEEVGLNIVEDLIHAWWKIAIGILLAVVACIIYILILRWTAAPMVWLSIIGVVVALAAGLYFTSMEYTKAKERYNNVTEFDEESKSHLKTKRDLWLAGLIILAIVTTIILLMLIFLRKRIALAIALIKEGSKAVSSVTASLFFPIFPWILQLGVIAYAIAVAIYLSSIGKPLYATRDVTDQCHQNTGILNNTKCDPEAFLKETRSSCIDATCKFIKLDSDALYPYMQVYNVFGFFWLAFFVTALGQMVLAGIFAQWYWTFHKKNLPFFSVTSAFFRALRYHIGTLAFGSLIIAICRMIRVVLEYIDQKLKKYDNELTKAIMCLLKCFFYCLEKFLKFINKNAYIMCAVHGKNFCASAKDAFMLLMRNIIRVFVLDKVTDFLFFLSKLLLTLGVGAVSYVFFATDLVSFIDNSNLNYGLVPVVIIMISTYLIASLFFSVYSMAVDTLFLCFLEDCERNDGTPQKPYFMSKNLMKIFGKRNRKQD
ncbi:unnamed protein product [Phaedon cochleariae]|uniref:Choline transporter-like protein n=1 Tax=Phaedon cochleariae TaxID=80249 RepID=A0A9N9X1H6_PHACE|nr:unnamed protein product [Phaedon cochleariae]